MHTFYPLTALLACAAAAPQPMSRRQFTIPPTPDTSSYAPIGDGSPRQAYLYEQVTPPHHCGAEGESCSISNTEVETSTISWSAGVGDTLGFISAGFSVSKSKTQGFTASCNAGSGDSNANSVCVWARIAHTGYEVQAYRHRQDSDPESGDPEGDPLYIWAPNSGNTGHGYICAHDDECGSEGDQWWGRKSEGDALWDAEENKGGPQDYVWGTDPENRWN